MTEVEFNSCLAEKAPAIGEERKKMLKKDFYKFMENYPESKYFALMGQPTKGRENRYVTLFTMSDDREKSIKDLQSFLTDENPQYLGVLKGYYAVESKYIEFWYGKDCYLFFEYQNGVIEVGK